MSIFNSPDEAQELVHLVVHPELRLLPPLCGLGACHGPPVALVACAKPSSQLSTGEGKVRVMPTEASSNMVQPTYPS
jgi:hypothetical protein